MENKVKRKKAKKQLKPDAGRPRSDNGLLYHRTEHLICQHI